MEKLTVAILFGGVSSEHEVSLVSGASVIRNTPADRYDIVMIGITRDGRWLHYDGPVDLIPDGRWETSGHTCPAILSPDRSHHGLLLLQDGRYTLRRLDAAFPVLHGKNGEDGTIQGLFAVAGIPFVGCATLSSAACMDKAVTHTLLADAGVPQAKWVTLFPADCADHAAVERRLADALGYPMFVKPANAGSSVGITKAHDADELRGALELAFSHDSKVVVEEFIDGIEVESAVLGNPGSEPFVSVLGEIVPCKEFYDYEAKYQNDATELYIPARISEEDTQKIRQVAAKAFSVLGCAGMARVDFFVLRDGSGVVLNEPNTIPGFTSISMYPKLMEASGVPYPALIHRLFQLSIEIDGDATSRS